VKTTLFVRRSGPPAAAWPDVAAFLAWRRRGLLAEPGRMVGHFLDQVLVRRRLIGVFNMLAAPSALTTPEKSRPRM